MLLAHHRSLIDRLRQPTEDDPWRTLVSGCLAGWRFGADGTDYGLGGSIDAFLALRTVQAFPYCPEEHALGTPRTLPDIHGGDGFDVLAGWAGVLDERGEDLTVKLLDDARAMLAFARETRAEIAILTDMSAACGSQVISGGCRRVEPRRYRRGVGVATALLLEAGIPVASQRDFLTLARLRARAEPGYQPPADARDHHEHEWTTANLPGRHPRV